MFTPEELLPISALQHLVYCPRQCALIHVERVWSENELTAEGQVLHKRTNEGRSESLDGKRIVRSMDLVSYRLGLAGKSDVVEFIPRAGLRPKDANRIISDIRSSGGEGWKVTPIEYKRGGPKTGAKWGDCDRVQLCAQALCLEEMLGVSIEFGQLFYGEKKRKLEVAFDQDLRTKTEDLCTELRLTLYRTSLPRPVNDKRCDRCSLKQQCMPEQTFGINRASTWIARKLASL
ncbi:MAG: CRISPR-associated protein Cas4, partial [Pirellula sp.]|nr:CRISPR-associated protein Cas4 [Pirellula sp.]